ncbi:hypothetical protein [Actinomadura opuntiae]|uniref:hypothetical protein n=1 Tax=Actinomadura sp. OS1-43 TaxID=604315 RepID=UPI00255AE7B1|nr:hypothetical protein [Actinomadura sp. OS1-43]MDL4816556.1 hypothetical protein [Actinomadura sp. OS1-43]
MRRTLTLLALAGLAAGTATAVPASAQAAVTAQAQDGYFYAWTGTNETGTRCRWYGNSSDWGTCRNEASSLWDNGYTDPGDPAYVRVFWGQNWTGAYTCIRPGWYISDLRPRAFDDYSDSGTDTRGFGQTLNDNIASHSWITDCEQ